MFNFSSFYKYIQQKIWVTLAILLLIISIPLYILFRNNNTIEKSAFKYPILEFFSNNPELCQAILIILMLVISLCSVILFHKTLKTVLSEISQVTQNIYKIFFRQSLILIILSLPIVGIYYCINENLEYQQKIMKVQYDKHKEQEDKAKKEGSSAGFFISGFKHDDNFSKSMRNVIIACFFAGCLGSMLFRIQQTIQEKNFYNVRIIELLIYAFIGGVTSFVIFSILKSGIFTGLPVNYMNQNNYTNIIVPTGFAIITGFFSSKFIINMSTIYDSLSEKSITHINQIVDNKLAEQKNNVSTSTSTSTPTPTQKKPLPTS